MANWKIGSRGGTCGACARDFAEGERHVSTLAVNEEAQLLREDRCSACWTPPAEDQAEDQTEDQTENQTENQTEAVDANAEAEAPVAASDQPLFWWFTHYQEEKKKKTLQLDLAALEQIFVSLEGREEEPVRELRYLLCLILMRKRRVKLEKLERGAEGESFLVKRPRRDQRFRVFVFDFTPERVAELRAQLQALFDGADLETGMAAVADGVSEGDLQEGDQVSEEGEGDDGSEPGIDGEADELALSDADAEAAPDAESATVTSSDS